LGVWLSSAGFFSPKSGTSSAPVTPPSTAVTTPSQTPSETTSTTPSETPSTPDTVNIIPDAYNGRDINTVRNELIALGLQVDAKGVVGKEASGTVTNVNPAGPVAKGSTITVTYSTGPEMVAVPNLNGTVTDAQVRQALTNAGLVPQAGSGSVSSGTVTFNPPSGTEVAKGSTVTFTITAPEPPTTPTPKPSGSPTP
ncbi:MAG: PASTA domain-containing protein, partial [Arthrobacter sp.]|nr:PASTA domain-containing protein [Arthrobacter sp.]